MIGCVVAALIFWCSIRLSERYSTTETIELDYALPVGSTFAQDPPSSIEAKVTATGWNLLREQLRRGNRRIMIDSIDLRQNPDGIISLRREIAEAFVGQNLQVDAITNPRVVVRTEQLADKYVPLELRSDLTYHPGFSAAGQATLSVDSVLLTGPRSRIREINKWFTDTLSINGLRDSARTNVAIQVDPAGAIQVEPKSTEVFLRVQQYTERSLYVPVKISGYSGTDSISVFPAQVLVTCAIGLEDYERLSPEVFELVVEFDNANTQFVRELPVIVRTVPNYVVTTTVVPRVVELFVIKAIAAQTELKPETPQEDIGGD